MTSAKEDLENAEDDLRFALELITDRLQDIKSKDSITRDDITQLIIDIQRGVMFEEHGIVM